jgi:polysaccharide biosynthesis transport protein
MTGNYGYDEFAPQGAGDGLSGILANVASVVRQRKWLLIAPLVIASILSIALAFLWPATYRSKAVLLVESSQLQTDNNGQVLRNAIDERVAKVRQEVLSRPDLIAIIQELQLYPRKRSTKSLSQIVEDMREDILIEPVSSELTQRPGSQAQTIAFSMSYDYESPVAAQAVAQKLVERVLEVDSTRTTEQATDTVRFLTDQADTIRARMSEIEQQITGIKSRYGQVLSSPNLTMLGGSSGSADAQIMMLESQNSMLRSQNDSARKGADRDPVVVSAEAELAAARATYTERHPDVVRAEQRLAEAKRLAVKNIRNLPLDTVSAQIASNNRQIAELRVMRGREQAQTSAVINAQSKAPVIQEQVSQLQQQLQGLNLQYQDTAKKLDTAKTSLRVETEQRGERLTLVDPPVVDDDPIWPNRWLVMGGGAGVGLLLGLLATFLAELLLQPLRGPFAAAQATGGELLGALPVIDLGPTARDDRKQEARWKSLWPKRNKMVEA